MGEQRKRVTIRAGGHRSGRRARQAYVTAADLEGPLLDLSLAPEEEAAVVQGLERARAEAEQMWAAAFDESFRAPRLRGGISMAGRAVEVTWVDGTVFHLLPVATLETAPDLEIWAWRDRGER